MQGAGGDPAGTGGPDYIAHRLKVWETATASRKASAQASNSSDEKSIKVTLPNGDVKDGIAFKTSPMEIAMGISQTLARKALVAIVNDKQWDMNRPMEEDCTLRICDFSTPEGKSVLWHSTAHMLGEALEYKYKGELCIGPPLEDGFYYDIHLHGDDKVTESDFDDLNKRVGQIAKQKRTFERLELTKEEALDMFSYNPFKTEIINELPPGATITAYRDGPFIDLCRGPHVPQSTRVKAVMCKGTGQAYWRAKSDNPSLQRVYGISFPEKELLKEYKTFLEEAARRDHRALAAKQELVLFNQLSPGSPFFLPHGQRIFNTLQAFMREQYWKHDFTEVQTPNLFDFDLWTQSGHAANYKDNMFSVEVEGREFGLKPMNCPSHCLIFKSRSRSYRELPLRLADFGVLHRNELSGTLGGLTRVRRFQQDDAHIFCREDQVQEEVGNCLKFLKSVYDIFGFQYSLQLSTRPEKYIGEVATWDRAEDMLAQALIAFTGKQCGEKDGWDLNPADGAFYGPKIDIKLFDALRRQHQCATLQLDFQLPIRFDLQYQAGSHKGIGSEGEDKEGTGNGGVVPTSESREENATDVGSSSTVKDGFARPVIVHRAIFGSLERFMAILIEHYAGYWPFWLSPRQAIVLPVSEKFLDYAKEVQKSLREGKFHVDVDSSDRTLGKKRAEARNQYYNVILVVGEQELNGGTVNMRVRGDDASKALTVPEVRKQFEAWRSAYE